MAFGIVRARNLSAGDISGTDKHNARRYLSEKEYPENIKIGGRNDYRDNLHLFDVPLIRSGFKKFSSQLNMSEKFGLNRNTLRKKIADNEDYL